MLLFNIEEAAENPSIIDTLEGDEQEIAGDFSELTRRGTDHTN